MKSLGLCACGLVLVLTASACSSADSTPTTSPGAAATIVEPPFSGTVPAPVAGVQQSSVVTFTVTQPGNVSLQLTSAVETVNGATNFAAFVGLAIGSVDSTGACILAAGVTPAFVQAGPQVYTGTLNAGKACVQISGQSAGSVAYVLNVAHS